MKFFVIGLHLPQNKAKLETQMNTRSHLLLLSMCAASNLVAGEVDQRFDGKWAGTETFFLTAHGGENVKAPNPNTVIVIADHGKQLGIASGWLAARYEVSPESHGNTLIYRMSGGKVTTQGREECKLVLSPDGNTLEETGHALMTPASGRWYEPRPCRVTGTFHRQGK